MVYRVYVEKKKAYAEEAEALLADIRSFLRIDSLEKVRIVNRYDVSDISVEWFEKSVKTVFSEPQVDDVFFELSTDGSRVFATEYLPGQFDQRADSAAQCIQLASLQKRPKVATARIYLLYGAFSDAEFVAIKGYLMNPVECREASLNPISSLDMAAEEPGDVKTIEGFVAMPLEALSDLIARYGFAMDLPDIAFCQNYFAEENRDPTLTELRMLDTYWSDHCRHTTFLTAIEDVAIEDEVIASAYSRYLDVRRELGREGSVTLMELATIGARYLKYKGVLNDLDESAEVNACTVRITVDVDGQDEEWLLLFKNETHNHPTEIEPFGGAATCIGGAIRDPLSGRAYVYQAMRVTGAGDPLKPIEETLPGKLPQKKLTVTAANGYSSYGNQIGLATGLVDEIYHEGYAAKRLEIGAVLGAAPRKNVRREEPAPGDVIVLLGGRTGRDGCGGATGSSKSHDVKSIEECGAEVQKGNAPEERKLQRLMRSEASLLIKRCNDFGAGGVSVAIGELADGLTIDLDAVPKKYAGLSGTELAISESQERMAVALDEKDLEAFMAFASAENLEATPVARVTEEKRLKMYWRGKKIVDIDRGFLDSNGAEKHARARIISPQPYERAWSGTLAEGFAKLAGDLNVCSKRGLSERFDSTIGAGTVLMPFGGIYQRTPIQAMVAKIPVFGETNTCSAMAYGYNPLITEKDPYRGAYLAVVESLSKLVAVGAGIDDAHLTFQEYFERLGADEDRWGKPIQALLGAFMAQLDLNVASIGGKDSMSGSFESLNVPPTLVSFAVSTAQADKIVSPEFKGPGNAVAFVAPKYENGLPTPASLKETFRQVAALLEGGRALSAYAVGFGGIAEAVMKMCFGNRMGFAFDDGFELDSAFAYCYGGFVLELAGESEGHRIIGRTTVDYALTYKDERAELEPIESVYEGKLESVFKTRIPQGNEKVPAFSYEAKGERRAKFAAAKPRVLIPVFPGTNCEYDTARAMERAGAQSDIFVIKNLSPTDVAESAREFARRMDESQILFIPGGFSGGDEPDGSGKFITAFFRNPRIMESVQSLLNERDGLMAGVCNGFQALVKLGLLPFGEIRDADENSPTLTFNRIGRHQSKLVRTRVCSNLSPWLMDDCVGDIHLLPVSHGEGRLIVSDCLLKEMEANGQIATQYVGVDGVLSMDIDVNPNGSVMAIEGITSPDGRIFGKMGHSERFGANLYKNVAGGQDPKMFVSAVRYFK